MDEDIKEQRLALIKAIEGKLVANVNVLPDPVDLIRADRDR